MRLAIPAGEVRSAVEDHRPWSWRWFRQGVSREVRGCGIHDGGREVLAALYSAGFKPMCLTLR